MKHKIGLSQEVDPEAAIAQATVGLSNPKLIFFFANIENFSIYSEKLYQRFPSSLILGSTTFAAFSQKGAYKKSLLVTSIESGIECQGGVLEEVDRYPLKYIDRVETCLHHFKDTNNMICFEVSTALKSCEELVLSTLNSALEPKGIPLFGGSAGDNGTAEKTLISFNGRIYDNGCAFALIKNLSGRIKLYRENIYRPTQHRFTATKVDAQKRLVYEYDNEPAAKVMAKALSTNVAGLTKYLDSHPLGRVVGNSMYITANQAIAENGAMTYHARIYNNSQMVLLEPDDYRAVIKQTISKIKKDIPSPSFAIMVNCLARSLLFEQDHYLDSFAKEMGSALGNYIGFAGYGEQLKQQHFNQTMILAVFE